jgi:hypothetical protein
MKTRIADNRIAHPDLAASRNLPKSESSKAAKNPDAKTTPVWFKNQKTNPRRPDGFEAMKAVMEFVLLG